MCTTAMANNTMLSLDSFELAGRGVVQGEGSGLAQLGEDAGSAFSLLDSTPLGKIARTPLADLALDLALNEIVQQARLATTATGATIRLVRRGELLSRAAAGATAPEIVAYLRLRGGIVDTCLRTGGVQRCDDAENDSRLDASTCRRLGLRSILIFPVRNLEQQTVGVIEVFSARARAFADGDVLALQALSRRVLANIDLAAKIMPAAPSDRVSPRSPGDRVQPEFRASEPVLQLVPRTGGYSVRNRMLLVALAVAAPALLVGWIVGELEGTGRLFLLT
jgi:hypothetical protein